jgi:serine/threonine protein phosphatase PrpC
MSCFIQETESTSATIAESSNATIAESTCATATIAESTCAAAIATESTYKFQFGEVTDIGGSRKNQDAYFTLKFPEIETFITCVLDGHGSEYGEHIAEGTKKFMIEQLSIHQDRLLANPEEFLSRLFDEANENCKQILMEVLSRSSIQFKEENGVIYSRRYNTSQWSKVRGGTTCSIVVIIKNKLYTANVGDSKALLCSTHLLPFGDYCEMEITSDQSLEKYEEFKRIHDCGGLVVFDKSDAFTKHECPPVYEYCDEYDDFIKSEKGIYYKNVNKEWATVVVNPNVDENDALAMSRSLGDLSLKRYGVIASPSINSFNLDEIFNSSEESESDTICIVLASDGVWDN